MGIVTNEFQISTTQTGQAFPVWDHHLAPAVFDDALGATGARKEWEQANADGLATYRALAAKRKAWMAENRESDFSDRAAWKFALDKHLRDDEAAVKAAEKRSVAALRAYHGAQRANGSDLAALAKETALAAHEKAKKAVADLEAALKERMEAVAHAGGTINLRDVTTILPVGVAPLVDDKVLVFPAPPAPEQPGQVRRGARPRVHEIAV
ncbi:hypothetical protein N865_01415 [Intrasporangium oryzae NRRL B-24470]|uniref:Uncharacterized protein n=1 Tax=Intrasporangium oryzae NRRL B-24470 TaxID=1386089 RepID=W9G6T0_9MICO|nr:hypothetical protein [Intrasporangium oryzae]EWS99573.1 hypothetical protein N865_01415 [Intrasporangium oryzae NRRL B-24470]